MSVTIRRPGERVGNSALGQAWGLIGDRLASDSALKAAVLLVLGYEQDLVPTGPFIDLPADIAHAQACFAAGKREGLDRAALSLLDPDYIADVRERLDEANKENES